MDIQRWLQDTTDRRPPDRTDQLLIPDFKQARSEARSWKYRNKKHKRPSTDSSLILHKPARPDHEKYPSRRSGLNVGEDRRSSSPLRKRYLGSRTPSAADDKTYERRPRRKTRPDRYEPKTRNPTKGQESRKEKKLMEKRRKSHRSGDGERTAGLVQSFQLKSRPKNDRLTLKPEKSGGIFKHGRASTQMTGRGSGLPDLVFNEMKFLRQPREHQDEQVEDEAPQQTRKTNRKRSNEEDISAYFTVHKTTSARPPDNPHKRHKVAEAIERGHADEAQDIAKQKTPPFKLPERPFLGFGSKGANLEHAASQHRSSGYFSWSESNLAQFTSAQRVLASKSKRQFAGDNPGRRSPYANEVAKTTRSVKERGDAKDVHVGSWIQTKRGPDTAQVEVYQPPTTRIRDSHKHNTSVTRTTQQSLPRQPSPEDDPNVRPAINMPPNQRLPSGYRTSDILEIDEMRPLRKIQRQANLEPQLQSVASGKENYDPDSSIDKLLDQAHKVIVAQAIPAGDAAEPTRQLSEAYYHGVDDRLQTPPTEHTLSHRVPLHEFSNRKQIESMHGPQSAKHSMKPRVPAFGVSTRASSHAARGHFQEQRERQSLQRAPSLTVPQYEMTDQARNPTHPHFTKAESLVYEPGPEQPFGIFESQAEDLEVSSNEGPGAVEITSMKASSTHGLLLDRTFPSERAAEPQAGVVTGVAGFWKPNKLY